MLSKYNDIITLSAPGCIEIKKDIVIPTLMVVDPADTSKTIDGPALLIKAGTCLKLDEGPFQDLLYAAYDYQQMSYDIKDAQSHSEEVLSDDDRALLTDVDYVRMAEIFRDKYSSNIADYDQWAYIIESYVETLKAKKEQTERELNGEETEDDND